MYYYKTCVLCDEKIRTTYDLCAKHYKEFGNQINEPWFKELAALQQEQDDIDKRERYNIPYYSTTDIHGVYEPPKLLSKKDVGRPSTDWRIAAKVLEVYDESVDAVKNKKAVRVKSLRQIAREVGHGLGYVTCRNILLKYRKESYKNKQLK